MTSAEFQTNFETDLTPVVNTLAGRGATEDWALVRALVHKAVHLAAEQRLDYCAVATLMAEMTQHAHQIMHSGHAGHTH